MTLVDLRHLVRNLRRSPASAAAAILTLSLTLGAGASIFSTVDAVVLTPPPFARPDRLVTVGEVPLDDPAAAPRTVRYATFEAWRERAGALARLEASDGTNLTLTGLGAAERVTATNVTPEYLTLLGVRPALGRSFDENDVARPVVIVSDKFWRGKLAGDRHVIGRELVLGGQPHTIVGVLPERVGVALTRDMWRPFPVTAAQAVRGGYRVGVLARLADRATAASLNAVLDEVSRASAPRARAVATSLAAAIAGGAPTTLGLLAGAAGLAMLIAFTNLAGLLLVRSIDRRRELAVRSALGARRIEIARQLLLEAEVLVAIGIAGGVLLALWMTPIVGRLALDQPGATDAREIAVSWRAIGVVSMVAAASALLCGLLPAAVAARHSLVDLLRRGATAPPRERILRRVFVAGEVTLAFVLLVSMMLVGRSLAGVLEVDPGFDARGLMALNVSLPNAKYPDPARVASFYSGLLDALDARLGPRAVSLVDEIPLTGDRGRGLVTTSAADVGLEAVVRSVGPGYFDVMRIPIRAGRALERGDDAAAPARMVVSESLATRLFGSGLAVGREVRLTGASRPIEIVGVAGTVKHRALDEAPLPTVYLAAAQSPSPSSVLVVRGNRPDADVIAAVRDEVARLDRDLPVYGNRPMSAVVAASPGVPVRRVLTAAFTGFAALAVVLGALGLFGVAAHDVAARRTELALRMALGADAKRLVTATITQSALMLGAGLLAGGLLSIWATRALRSVLFETSGVDLMSLAVAVAVLVAAGACAVLPAALRAARTDPLTALRAE